MGNLGRFLKVAYYRAEACEFASAGGASNRGVAMQPNAGSFRCAGRDGRKHRIA
jgi:hypothetical protein